MSIDHEYRAFTAFQEGQITLGEYHQLVDLDLFYRLVSSVSYERDRQQYAWERKNKVPLPRRISKRQVFDGLQEAIEQRFHRREEIARDMGRVFDRAEFEGHATYDEVGCAIAGISIDKRHHVSGARKTIPYLKSLVEEGLVAPHYHEGSNTQSGWQFTELGERVAEGLVEFRFDDE